MKKFTPTEYAIALYQAIAEVKPDDYEKVLANFVQVLKEQNKLSQIDEIQEAFMKYDREARGVKQAEITTAKPLAESEEKQIISKLNKHLDADVELKKKVDEGVIGGVSIRVDDEQIDGTVKRFLKDLKKKITN